MSDFFDTHTGNAEALDPGRTWRYRLRDLRLDFGLVAGRAMAGVRKRDDGPRARVLIVGVEVPSRAADIHRVMHLLATNSQHDITVSIAAMQQRGKFENIDEAIRMAPQPLAAYDWLIVTDDDISFAPGFVDDLIALARAADLSIAQPAHAIRSHTTYAITKRKAGSLVRRTSFVEIGPLTLVRANAFDALIPFPASRWCYGIDVLWSEIADRENLRMGIVDATPIRHLRPVAASYDMDEARTEGRELLTRYDVTRSREQVFARDEIAIATRQR